MKGSLFGGSGLRAATLGRSGCPAATTTLPQRPAHLRKLATTTAALLATLFLPHAATAQRLGTLDGHWQGKLDVVSATAATPEGFWRLGDRPEISLEISGNTAALRVKRDEWQEIRLANGFRVSRVEESALVYALHVANGWVENWMLSVTKRDGGTMLVFLSYVAGGSLEHIDEIDTEFAVGAMGELTRAGRGE